MTLLILSLAMLALAPKLYQLTQRFQRLWMFTQRGIAVAISCLVVLHLLPESIEFLGWYALVIAGIGLFLPSLLERLWRQQASLIHYIPVILGLSGLVLHGMMDGAALAGCGIHHTGAHHNHSHHGHSHGAGGSFFLQLAVLLHRIPAAILLWSWFYPKGLRPAITVLLTLAISTLIGYGAGASFFHRVHDQALWQGFQALVAGSLLHIAFDQHEADHV